VTRSLATVTTPLPLPEFARPSGAILVVEGAEPVRIALEEYLRQEKFDVRAAGTLSDALRTMAGTPIGCILLDDGVADGALATAVSALLEREPTAAILLLAGDGSAAAIEPTPPGAAVEQLRKPVDLFELGAAVRRALRRRDALLESARLNNWLQEEVSRRTAELQRERENLQQLSVAALETLVNALEAKDPHLLGHSARVAGLSERVAEALRLAPETVALVRVAGRLHDIGKIGIREQVLNKAGPLTDEEFAHIKEHPALAARILAPLVHLGEAIGYIRSHHEHWDGQGYPDGLAGDGIPIGGRIIGAVEIYDALTTSRPYQETMPPPQALVRMRELAGTVLDPTVQEALARVIADEPAAPPPRAA